MIFVPCFPIAGRSNNAHTRLRSSLGSTRALSYAIGQTLTLTVDWWESKKGVT